MFQNIPKKVGIIVKSGQYLEYTAPGSKKSPKTYCWEVIFKGSKDKMTTELIEAADGCPVWDCEVTLDLVSPCDPIVMLVQDGKRHHIGQVVVPLDEVPQTGPPNFDPSRLRSSDLDRTKKNSNPRGRLLYWIWAISYWPPGTNYSLGSSSKSKTLRGSLSNLSVHKSKQQNKSAYSGNDDGQSSCGSLARAPSMVSGAAHSMVSGGSFSESMLPPGGRLDLPPGAPRGPYNPMALNDDDRASVVSGGSQSYLSGRPPIYQHHFNQNAAATLGPPDDTSSIRHKGKNRILSRMKSRLSKSSLHLNKAAALAGGQKVYSNGSLLSVRTSDDRPNSSMTLQYPSSQVPREEFPGSNAAGNVGSSTAGSQLQLNPSQTLLRRQNNPATPNDLATPNSPATAGARKDWGLHPEERPHKPLEEMSQREIKEYALQMEHKLQVSKVELARLQTENAELVKRAETAEKDLSEMGITLATLRIKLLEDNLTEYLEVPSDGSDGYLNFGGGMAARGQFRRSMSASHLLSAGPAGGRTERPTAAQPQASPVQSFFAKLSAINLSGTRKPSMGDGAAVPDPDSSLLFESANGDTDWW